MRLRAKVSTLTIGILLAGMSLLSIPLYWYARVALEAELDNHLRRISSLLAANLDRNKMGILASEPDLNQLSAVVSDDLSSLLTSGIIGINLYDPQGTILAGAVTEQSGLEDLTQTIPTLIALKHQGEAAVSEVFELKNGSYVKAAALPLSVSGGKTVILVLWAGASYMDVIQQIQGGLFWIFLVSLIMAMALALVFSSSLLKPVNRLANYAQSIQSNISSPVVHLKRNDELGDLNRSLMDMHVAIQKQEEADRQLLAGIAHELKNPLGGIEIYSGLLKEELNDLSDPSQAKELSGYLEKVNLELHHLKSIVQEYLDFARPLKSVDETLSLHEILENIRPLLEPNLRKTQQQLLVQGDAEVLGDRNKLQRIFINLLHNSMEASKGAGDIRVAIRAEGKWAITQIIDQGAGIPPEDHERIFEPYFSTRDRGYGLGLAIVRSMVQEMNGTILVQNSGPEGTTLEMKLPGKGSK